MQKESNATYRGRFIVSFYFVALARDCSSLPAGVGEVTDNSMMIKIKLEANTKIIITNYNYAKYHKLYSQNTYRNSWYRLRFRPNYAARRRLHKIQSDGNRLYLIRPISHRYV